MNAVTARGAGQVDFFGGTYGEVGVRASRFTFAAASGNAVRSSHQYAIYCGVFQNAYGPILLMSLRGTGPRFDGRVEVLAVDLLRPTPTRFSNGVGREEWGLVGARHYHFNAYHLHRTLCRSKIGHTPLYGDVQGRNEVVLWGTLSSFCDYWG